MPLGSPSGVCWASANGSPEIIQEFVICESSRNPRCQLVRPSSAATSSPFSHTRFHCLPFPARYSGKAQGQRRALASTALAGARLLKTVYRMAQHLRLARERRGFGGGGESGGCVFLLSNGDSGLLYPYQEASPSFGNCSEERLDHRFFSLLFHFHRLV